MWFFVVFQVNRKRITLSRFQLKRLRSQRLDRETRDLIIQHAILLRKDPTAAERFFKDHQNNKLFTKVAPIQEALEKLTSIQPSSL